MNVAVRSTENGPVAFYYKDGQKESQGATKMSGQRHDKGGWVQGCG